jgi:hypothetical protein
MATGDDLRTIVGLCALNFERIRIVYQERLRDAIPYIPRASPARDGDNETTAFVRTVARRSGDDQFQRHSNLHGGQPRSPLLEVPRPMPRHSGH